MSDPVEEGLLEVLGQKIGTEDDFSALLSNLISSSNPIQTSYFSRGFN